MQLLTYFRYANGKIEQPAEFDPQLLTDDALHWIDLEDPTVKEATILGSTKPKDEDVAVIDPDSCFGAFACSICQAACPVAGCIVEEPDRDGRMVCAVRADLCIGCGLCVTLGNPTAPQQREFGCPADYDAINMVPFEEVVRVLRESERLELTS